jgi:hypothetical protein
MECLRGYGPGQTGLHGGMQSGPLGSRTIGLARIGLMAKIVRNTGGALTCMGTRFGTTCDVTLLSITYASDRSTATTPSLPKAHGFSTSEEVTWTWVLGQLRAQGRCMQSHRKLSAELHPQPSAALHGRNPLGTIPRDAQSVDLVARKHLVSTSSFGTRTRVAPATKIMLLCASPQA